MNEEDELFKKCFIKTLKKLAEEPDEVINYNEQLKKYNNLLKEKIKLQQELQRKDNIIDNIIKYVRTFKTDEITTRELCILNDILLITEEKENIVVRLKEKSEE